MRSYLSTLPDVNAADLRAVPEPQWSYQRRTEWSGEHNPAHRRGSGTRLRRKLELRVDREDRWLAAFLRGEVTHQLDPLVRCVLHVLKTGVMPDGATSTPAWVHEVRLRLERALALRPADWWAVAAPPDDATPAKPRMRWWVPRRSWHVAWAFLRAVRALRGHLVAIHAETVRRSMARRDAEVLDRARRLSDLRSGHPYPQRKEEAQQGRFASGETEGGWQAVAARIAARVDAAGTESTT
jgi:hypothetical protein